MHGRMSTIDQCRTSSDLLLNAHTDGGRSDSHDESSHQPFDFLWSLIRDEAKAEFNCGHAGDDPFRAFATVTAAQTGDGERWTEREPLIDGITGFAPLNRSACFTKNLLVGGPGPREISPFAFAPSKDPVIETRDGDPPARAMQSRHHFTKRL